MHKSLYLKVTTPHDWNMSYGTFSLRWCRLTLIGLGCCCAGLWLALWWRGGSMRLRRVQGFAVRLYLLPFDLIVSDNLENPKLCHAELWHTEEGISSVRDSTLGVTTQIILPSTYILTKSSMIGATSLIFSNQDSFYVKSFFLRGHSRL